MKRKRVCCRIHGEDDDILIVYEGYRFKSLILLLSGVIVFNLLGDFLQSHDIAPVF